MEEKDSPLCANNERKTAQVEVVEQTPQLQAKKENKAWTITKKLCNRWFIDAFSGMAQGLFVTLIAGTIFKQIGLMFGANNGFGQILVLIGNFACTLMGAGIGVGIAKYLKCSNLIVFGSAVAGWIGAFLPDIVYKAMINGAGVNLLSIAQSVSFIKLGIPGNPIGAYVATIFALEIVSLYAGKTKLDILIVPLGILFMSFITTFVAIPAIWLVAIIGKFVALATNIQPFLMGIVIAVVMGILLTMPTSSAAIWIAIASPILSNPDSALADKNAILLAGGAAVVGCCCQMVGFAVMSYKENGFSGLISQGLGTSMLQIPNIMRNPKIFLPPIVASAICGPLATCVFQLRCSATGGGMGTSGLVGVIGTFEVSNGVIADWKLWIGVILLEFILPALISWAGALLLRKIGWIKENDLKLNMNN